MKLSIIVTVYNIYDYIGDCLDSIINQMDTECELVIIDDGSIDGSAQICDSYAEKYDDVKVFHKKNGGVSEARNYGIAVSNGDFFTFIDGDDYVDGSMIKNIMGVTAKNTDIILSNQLFLDDGKGNIGSRYRFDEREFDGITGQEALAITTSKRPDWSPCGKVFNKRFWIDNEFKFRVGTNWEDFQLIDRVILVARNVCMIPGFYYYRSRGDSITHSVSEKDILDILSALEDWEIFFESNDIDKKVEQGLRNQHAVLFGKTVMGYLFLVKTNDRKKLIAEATARKAVLFQGYSNMLVLVQMMCKVIGFSGTCRLLSFIKGIRYNNVAR